MRLKSLIKILLKRRGLEISRLKNNKWLSDYGINTILDIGANDGGFAKKIRQILPSTRIYSFEPLSLTFNNLVKEFEGDFYNKEPLK